MRQYIDYHSFETEIKNLGFEITKLDINYNQSDHRCWSAIINPSKDNLIATFTINKYQYGSHYFDLITQNRTVMDIFTSDIYDIITDMIGKTPVVISFESESNQE